jgi:activator of HSP90 ATPase
VLATNRQTSITIRSSKKLIEKKRTKTIRQKVSFLTATPRDVYRAFLSSKEHSEFTGSNSRCSARVDGRFTAWNRYISGKNIELVKNKKIVQEWKTTEWPEGYEPSILTISLEDYGNGTLLIMIQTKVPASQYEEYNQGWYESYWDPMNEYFRKRADSRAKKTKR